MTSTNHVLSETLDLLKTLYSSAGKEPGTLKFISIKTGWNVVIGTHGQCGMALNFSGWNSYSEDSTDVFVHIRDFIGEDLFLSAEHFIKSNNREERALGVAAISALSQPFLLPHELTKRGFIIPERSVDMVNLPEKDEIMGVVGYGRWVPKLIGRCKEIHVSDMRSRYSFQTMIINKNIHYYPEEINVYNEHQNKDFLPRAHVVSITGSTLINKTFEDVVSYCTNARIIALYGSSASIIPDILFSRGVNMLFTYRITDPKILETEIMHNPNMEPLVQSTQSPLVVRSSTFR